ncbi:heterokaryon incompatibility protein-domain-containing protein [Cadophora sp. MPI-SDFR-AT-0126]|nr:heterokaryon incompatibility protein-domain-containing protein [Leotiomycetes sp. MPI-SDFR-AT-0126]
MEPDVVQYSFPASSIKIRKREPVETQLSEELPNKSQRFKPETPDPFVEEPSKDFDNIKRIYEAAPGKYKYETIKGPNSIRLVELLPGDPAEIIRINVLEADLDANPEYDALSYEWGFREVTKSESVGLFEISTKYTYFRYILCDGLRMEIMDSLHALLLRLRHSSKSLILWTDAICINQDDGDEKPQQLMLMGRIYRQAKTVLCWIGEEKQNTHNAFRLIASIAAALHIKIPMTVETWVRSESEAPEIVLDEDLVDEVQGDGWLAVVDVFTRPYFGRIWVVQEIVLSQAATIICGSNRIPWGDFLRVSKLIAALGTLTYRHVEDVTEEIMDQPAELDYFRHLKVKDIVDQTDEDHFHFANKWLRVIQIGDLQEAKNSESRSLALCLELLLGHDVTNPLDRVYGMLGMITPSSHYTRSRPLVPSYKKSVQKVYREATKWAIRDLQSLRILDLCDSPGTNVTGKLPSWVPDLSKGPLQCTNHIGQRPTSLSMFSPQFSVSFSRSILSVRAHIADTIVVARPPFTFGLKPVLMMQHFKEFAYKIINRREPTYPTGCTKLEAFWRTLIANGLQDIKNGKPTVSLNPGPDFGKHFMRYAAEDFISNWGLPLKLTGQEPDLWELRQERAPFPLDQMFPEDVHNNISILALMAKHPFVRWMYDCLGEGDEKRWSTQFNKRTWLCDGDYGRQFVFTERGWMGVGPPCKILQVGGGNVSIAEGSGVKVGDVVAILAGSERVWILRRDGDGNYVIVGQAYVYGLSEGMGFDEKNLPEMEVIKIK